MMSTTELLRELFIARVDALAAEHGLTASEKDRILTAFRQAAANPFMSDEHIYHSLSGHSLSGHSFSGHNLSRQNPEERGISERNSADQQPSDRRLHDEDG